MDLWVFDRDSPIRGINLPAMVYPITTASMEAFALTHYYKAVNDQFAFPRADVMVKNRSRTYYGKYMENNELEKQLNEYAERAKEMLPELIKQREMLIRQIEALQWIVRYQMMKSK